jgi:hypothetical protein
MEKILASHEAIANFAQVFLAVLALIAVVAAFKQLRIARDIQREATASETHRAYIELAIKYPLFANPQLMLAGNSDILIDFQTETIGGSREKFEQYEWFISLMMLNFRELWHKSDDQIIRSLMLLNVRYHQAYFAYYESEWKAIGAKRYLAMYGADISRIISEISRDRGLELQSGPMRESLPEEAIHEASRANQYRAAALSA